MNSPIGYVVEGFSNYNPAVVRRDVDSLNALGTSVIADRDLALRLANSGRTPVVFRHIPKIKDDPDPDHEIHLKMTPQQWLEQFAPLTGPGLILSYNQEPDGYGDLRALDAHFAEVIDLCGRNGIPVCGPNFGAGHPADGAYAQLPHSLAMLAKYQSLGSGLSVHEYGADTAVNVPWYVGRYRQALALQPKINVYVTEYGLDPALDGSSVNGWHGLRITGTTYASRLIEGWKAVYAHDPQVKFATVFALVATLPRWENFVVQPARDFIARLEAETWESAPPPPPPTPPEPEPEPVNEWVKALDWLDEMDKQISGIALSMAQARQKSAVLRDYLAKRAYPDD